jgi:hypothetical protein
MGAVTIHGNGATIMRPFGPTPHFRLLSFSMSPSAIDHLSLLNGWASGDGGGVYASDIDISNCAFNSCHADGNGAGLAAATSTITDTTFDSNVAGDSGGGAFISGQDMSATFSGCHFANNIASTGNGGGIYYWSNGNLYIEPSSANESVLDGDHVSPTTGSGGNIFIGVGSLYLSGGTASKVLSGVAAHGADIADEAAYIISIDADVEGDALYPDSDGAAGVELDILPSINWDLMGDSVVVNGVQIFPPH